MKKIKCQRCGYEWETKSDHVYVSCPSCLAKVKTVDKIELKAKIESFEELDEVEQDVVRKIRLRPNDSKLREMAKVELNDDTRFNYLMKDFVDVSK